MDLFRLSPEFITGTTERFLEPGETIEACVFGMQVPGAELTRKILLYGLFVLGLIVLYFMQDKVFLVLTSRRLLVLTLIERTYVAHSCASFRREDVTVEALERGSFWLELRLVPSTSTALRFKVFPKPMGLPDNERELRALAAALGDRGADATGGVRGGS